MSNAFFYFLAWSSWVRGSFLGLTNSPRLVAWKSWGKESENLPQTSSIFLHGGWVYLQDACRLGGVRRKQRFLLTKIQLEKTVEVVDNFPFEPISLSLFLLLFSCFLVDIVSLFPFVARASYKLLFPVCRRPLFLKVTFKCWKLPVVMCT